MRQVIVDQFEFPDPSTEETVEIWLAKREDYSDLGVTVIFSLPALDSPMPFDQIHGKEQVRSHLATFDSIHLPEPCFWPTYYYFRQPEENHWVIEGPDCFIHYIWSCSA